MKSNITFTKGPTIVRLDGKAIGEIRCEAVCPGLVQYRYWPYGNNKRRITATDAQPDPGEPYMTEALCRMSLFG